MQTETLEIPRGNNFIAVFRQVLAKAVASQADTIHIGSGGEQSFSFIKSKNVFRHVLIANPKDWERLVTTAELHAGFAPRSRSADMMAGLADYANQEPAPSGASSRKKESHEVLWRFSEPNSDGDGRAAKLNGMFSHPEIPGIMFQFEKPADAAEREYKIYLWKCEEF